ncbi:MAG: autotransporter-associated beta strand repeat-containing protein, partial [Pseudomonadota bacterium]
MVASRGGYIGFNSGSNGSVLVDGGSRWFTLGNTSVISVAFNGTGDLTVSNGGQIFGSFGYIAERSGNSVGTAIVTGAGSYWQNSESLYVGEKGRGALTISQGGRVQAKNFGGIGRQSGSVGTVTVDGADSLWDNFGQFFVAEAGRGTLDVTSGGQVNVTKDSRIAVFSGSVGTASVSGENSTWTTGGNLFVGSGGQGTLTIADQAEVSVKGGSGLTFVGWLGGSTGVLNIGAEAGSPAEAAGTLKTGEVRMNTASSKLVFNHTGTDYVFAPRITERGSVEVYSGTTTLTGNNTYTGTTSVNGGTLLVNGSTVTGTVKVNAGGTLGGTGTIGGSTNINAGGTLSAGTSPGTLTIAGNLILDAESTSEFELGQPDTADSDKNDLVVVEGNAEIGGTLNLSDGAGGIAVSGFYTLFEVA